MIEMDNMNNHNSKPRYAVSREYFKDGYKWIDWAQVPCGVREQQAIESSVLEKYINYIPTEVIILLIKEFQSDTGLMAKIMQEEIYSKSLVNRHLDIIEQLIDNKKKDT